MGASAKGARLMRLGGAPLEGARHIWWSFVSSSPERITLPASGPAVVRYP